MKQSSGSHGWGNTSFAKAYNLKSDQDFLLNDDAQDAALGQAAKAGYKELIHLQKYIGDSFLTAHGRVVMVTDGGLFAAYHKQSGLAVRDYLAKYGDVISSERQGDGLGTVALHDHSKRRTSNLNVENRLQWGQYLPYEPKW